MAFLYEDAATTAEEFVELTNPLTDTLETV